MLCRPRALAARMARANAKGVSGTRAASPAESSSVDNDAPPHLPACVTGRSRGRRWLAMVGVALACDGHGPCEPPSTAGGESCGRGGIRPGHWDWPLLPSAPTGGLNVARKTRDTSAVLSLADAAARTILAFNVAPNNRTAERTLASQVDDER